MIEVDDVILRSVALVQIVPGEAESFSADLLLALKCCRHVARPCALYVRRHQGKETAPDN